MVTPIPQPSAEALAAQRMAMLRELGEMGMELARALKAQALAQLDPQAPDAPKVTDGDPVLMFTRVARAVRQTLALELRCSNPDAETGLWRAEAVHARRRRKDEVRDLAGLIIDEEAPRGAERRMRMALDARLDCDAPDDEDFTYLSTGVMLARICRELGIEPDWNRWCDYPWAAAEAKAQVPGSPFTGPNAPRILDLDWEPPEGETELEPSG